LKADLFSVGRRTVRTRSRHTKQRVEARIVHTYGSSSAAEVTNLVAVSRSKLLPLLPPGYVPLPATTIGIGRKDQGILAITNFQSTDPVVDHRQSGNPKQVAVDVAIAVAPPVAAAVVGLDIVGAYHL
jgi:hypothetical protein